MQKGDNVMADHPDSRGRESVRFYGVVQEVTKAGVIIEMADGSVINRHVNAIAVYIQPPANWPELFERQIVSSSQKQAMMVRRSSKKRRKARSPDSDLDSTSLYSLPSAISDF
ncbi:MAG: hypothetical protein IH612_17920 [Desulfofustis sp.]|nr:hypothetical protein [Desulfofustis sp.]